MERQLKIKLLPNNQVSLFTQTVKVKREEVYSDVPDYSRQPEWRKEYYRNGQAKFDRERSKTHETKRVAFYKADGSVKFRLLRVEKNEPESRSPKSENIKRIPTLDIKKKSQRKPKSLSGWGEKSRPKKFGHSAGQKIRECGAMMDLACGYDPSFCRVVTLTMPSGTHDSFDAMARYSGYVINRIFQPIRRLGLYDSHWFFVWEYQKRGALHLHIAISNPDKQKSFECGEKLVGKWIEILRDIQEESGVDMFLRADGKSYAKEEDYQNLNQEMRKSCGGYFSKYASKSQNTKENSYIAKYSKEYPPSRFWGSSKSLKYMCKQYSYV